MKSEYIVKLTQEIPFVERDKLGELINTDSTGRTISEILGSFSQLEMAKLFKTALEAEIAKSEGYVFSRYSPVISVFKAEYTENEVTDNEDT